jgi:hypothetical protein
MKMKWMIPALAATLFFAACGGNEHQHEGGGKSMNEAAVPEMSENDLLFEEVIALHDEAMPKMGKLKGYIKDLEQKIDSLNSLKDAGSTALKAEYATLLTGLKGAEKGMFDWMDNFQPELEGVTEDSLKNYYSAEKAKAQAMKDNIFSMIDAAAAKLGY